MNAGDIRLDTRSGKVTKDGEPVKLTAQEQLLSCQYLLGKVVSRTELIEHIYDQDFDRDSNAIEVFVTRIRRSWARTLSRPFVASATRSKIGGKARLNDQTAPVTAADGQAVAPPSERLRA